MYSTKPCLLYLNTAFLKRNLQNKNGKKRFIYVPFIEQLQPSIFPYIVEITGMPFLKIDIYVAKKVRDICMYGEIKGN